MLSVAFLFVSYSVRAHVLRVPNCDTCHMRCMLTPLTRVYQALSAPLSANSASELLAKARDLGPISPRRRRAPMAGRLGQSRRKVDEWSRVRAPYIGAGA